MVLLRLYLTRCFATRPSCIETDRKTHSRRMATCGQGHDRHRSSHEGGGVRNSPTRKMGCGIARNAHFPFGSVSLLVSVCTSLCFIFPQFVPSVSLLKAESSCLLLRVCTGDGGGGPDASRELHSTTHARSYKAITGICKHNWTDGSSAEGLSKLSRIVVNWRSCVTAGAGVRKLARLLRPRNRLLELPCVCCHSSPSAHLHVPNTNTSTINTKQSC